LGESFRVQQKTVLIIDDDELVLESIALLLSMTNKFETIRARGAADATLQLQSRQHVDVVIADVILAGAVSGLELCRTAIDCHPSIAVVVITADTEVHRSDVVERGVFLRKPFGADTLLAAIDQSFAQVPKTLQG
jgi:DNA-binding NtrC family response regulator